MNEGWVKLYRKVLDKKWLRYDHNLYIVFMWLLMVVDRRTGKYTLGRFYCKEIGMKPSTFRNALQRLKDCGILDIKSNNKYSEVQIVKWSLYQSTEDKVDTSEDNKRTTRGQQEDTKQEVRIENREIIHKNVLVKTQNFGNPDINECQKYFLEVMKLPLEDGSAKWNRIMWSNMIKEGGRGIAGVKGLIDLASKDDWFKNNITSARDLWKHRVKLVARLRGNRDINKIAVNPAIKEVI